VKPVTLLAGITNPRKVKLGGLIVEDKNMSENFTSLHRRKLLQLVLGASVIVLSLSALPAVSVAYDESSKAAINVDNAGIALHGYDPVAYFTAGKPTTGDKQFSAKHDGATYYFASAANRSEFEKNPAKYAPGFGGFCAMGAALGKKLDGDPAYWRIVDGKLYLNVGAPAQKRWLEDIPGNLTKANANWPQIWGKAPKEL
jgi:YHS domain-containing protein